jgi:esterase/lipase
MDKTKNCSAPTPKTVTPFEAQPVVPEVYGRYMRLLEGVISRLGVTIRVHGDQNLWREGDIFMFNHFARLETVLPPYLIWKHGGAITRSVAAKGLFRVHPKFTKFLSDTGVLPTDLPGLLPYLAAEILKGRKMMIFPEGGMVKDRKVMNAAGKYEIFSDNSNKVRKLHRGAAAIAQVLTLFKARIIMLEEKGDTARLERWRQALEFEDIASLVAAAHRPTRLVPATMTFYPVRNAPNMFTKLAKKLKPLSAQAEDELTIEGNLVTRATDLDVQLQEPIELSPKLGRWDSMLLDKVFVNISSLAELFALREKAEGWSEQLMSRKLGQRIEHLRDLYMEKLYSGVRVNLTHLAANLIMQRYRAGHTVLDVPEMGRVLYAAILSLQSQPGLYLHATLTDSDRYMTLATGEANHELKRIFDIAEQSGLVRFEGDKLHLLPALGAEWGSQEIRLRHPLAVAVNEVEPLPAIAKTVKSAWEKPLSELGLADALWANEQALFATAHADAATDQHVQKIDHAHGMPLLLTGDPKKTTGKTGIMLVHGFLSSPAQMQTLAEHLNARGHTVLTARIPGHGTSAWDLHATEATTWLPAMRRQYQILSARVDKVVVMGFSTGGMLALRLAATNPDKLAGVAGIAAPWVITERHLNLVPWVDRLNRATQFLTGGAVYPLITYPASMPMNYGFAPVSAVTGLLNQVKMMQSELPQLGVPTLLLQAEDDPLVAPESAEHIKAAIEKAPVRLAYVAAKEHNILTKLHAEAADLLSQFAANPVKATEEQ